MKKVIIVFIEILFILLYYYMFLPPINFHSFGFWFFMFISILLLFVMSLIYSSISGVRVLFRNDKKVDFELTKISMLLGGFCGALFILLLIVNFFSSPVFNAKSYSKRISVDENGNFDKDFDEADFNAIPLIDRLSSEKLGDRVMGKMKDLVSQFYVSNQYTQINYNDSIVRVTPLEYAGFIKWISNSKRGIPSYIIVNSVTGKSEMVNLDKGMKYMPSSFFNKNLMRKLRFSYPTECFGDSKFEIDNDGNPYWITPTYTYTAIELKKKVTGVVILDPITGKSKKYKIKDIPTWVDNAYSADLLIEQIDDWGTYKDGFLNSIFGQKGVVNTTSGYNYLAMNDDVYMYTGLTSVLSDESNLGFVLSNLRTGYTTFYSVPGAEEYSAMDSAQGQVQQMKYVSTFPLLIKLNGQPTYLVSLKDNAGLVKMYGFIDVEDYQKVVVTNASLGIKKAAQNYLDSYGDEDVTSTMIDKDIIVKTITPVSIDGTTYYYILDSDNNKYKVSIKVYDNLPFIKENDVLKITYKDKDEEIKIINKIIN